MWWLIDWDYVEVVDLLLRRKDCAGGRIARRTKFTMGWISILLHSESAIGIFGLLEIICFRTYFHFKRTYAPAILTEKQ